MLSAIALSVIWTQINVFDGINDDLRQNAALVQESAAPGERLSTQAERLGQWVAVFKLADNDAQLLRA